MKVYKRVKKGVDESKTKDGERIEQSHYGPTQISSS